MDADVVVVGAGAVGTSTALHLARAGLDVLVLEKEPGPALHQSGRNSGVLHPGFNHEPGTVKARFTVEGTRAATAYCEERGVPLALGGILVVARDEAEVATLDELERRSHGNGVEVRRVAGDGIQAIEPHAAGIAALHAPGGGSFDGRAYVHALLGDAVAAGASFLFDTRVHAVEDPTLQDAAREVGGRAPASRYEGPGVRVLTSKGPITARALVGCAGLQADRLAGALAPDVRVVPFRGYYAELRPPWRDLVRSHIYPAPDLSFPFLGVHLSRRADGRVIVGPGAMLAFGREAYRFRGVNLRDLASTLTWPGFWRLFKDRRFRGLVGRELRKSLSLGAVAREAAGLVPELGRADLAWSFAGNRAQMVDRRGNLVGDILVRRTDRAVHVLNAVSPGLTCSLPFGADLAQRAAELL